MARRAQLPSQLEGRIFSRAEAHEAGVTDRILRGPQVVSVAPGWYRCAHTEPTFELLARAGTSWLGAGSGLSHLSALAWRGLSLASTTPLHLATRRRIDRRVDGYVVHRFLGSLGLEEVRGVPVVGAARTFVDCGTVLSEKRLVAVGDWMVRQGLVSRFALEVFAFESHLDGVQRARKAVERVRGGAESFQESVLRCDLVDHGLPEPELNIDIVDDHGTFLGRGDLVYREEKVLVEYDGWHHERDARQRQHDIVRRERLEAHGWRVIVVTTADMGKPAVIALRVRRALNARNITRFA